MEKCKKCGADIVWIESAANAEGGEGKEMKIYQPTWCKKID